MATENKSYIEAMRGLRGSSAASPHANRHRLAKTGKAKGGRPRQHTYRQEA